MDVVQVLDGKIAKLPSGDHTRGLRAVRLHIDAAIGHFKRGQSEGDGTAFTDAIYRCNQAFEGSVKEAYRVLAGENPDKLSPARIENFLAGGHVLRARVLDQFTNYRKEWRNPSTHDYMLDFDEDEALLAIVSVSVFAAVLTGQIHTKLAADEAEHSAHSVSKRLAPSTPLQAEVARRVLTFGQAYRVNSAWSPMDAARQLEGSLAGMLAAEFSATPEVKVELGHRLGGREADVAVRRGEEMIAIEVKHMGKPTPSSLFSGLAYLADLMRRGFTGGVLLALTPGDRELTLLEVKAPDGNLVSVVVAKSMSGFLEQVEFH